MKKNFIKVVLSIFLVFMLAITAACSSSNTNSGSSESASSSGGEQEKTTEPIEFKLGTFAGPEHVQVKDVMVPFSEQVLEETEGRINFKLYTGAALSSPPETFDSIKTGIQDAGWIVGGYTPGQFPLHGIINLPHLSKGTAEQVSEVAYKLYEKFPEIQAEYSDVKPLWFLGTEEYVIMTNKKKVESLEDVKGLKLRAPNSEGGLIIESWGATPVSMPSNDMYDALQKGVIDGTVSSMSQLKDYNLYDVIKYITHGNFTNSIMSAPMNKSAWEKIPEGDKQILEEKFIGLPMSKMAGKAFDEQGNKAIEEGKAAGIEFIHMSKEELDKFEKASSVVTEKAIADLEAKGFPAQEIYDAAKEMFSEFE